MRLKRVDRPERQNRTKHEGHVGGAPHVEAAREQQMGQAHAAVFRIAGQGLPAAFDKLPVGFGQPGVVVTTPSLSLATFRSPAPTQRPQNVLGEFRGFLQRRLGDAVVEIGENALLDASLQASRMVHHEEHSETGAR